MSSPSRTPSLRVLTYNVHGLRDDRHALASVVREAAPDIVIVQEAPRRFRWRTKCAALAHSWGMLYAAGGLPALGNLIVTTQRIRVHQTWCLRYPLTPGRHLRGAVFARCSITGSDGHELSFVVAGTHLATDDAERPGQARAFADAVEAVGDPVIVGLDANETAGGPSWTMVADGRTDAAVACGDDRPTFPASRPPRRLDAMFVDPRWTVTAYEVIATDSAVAASDHLPVLVEVRPAA
ncbi:MAG TPA: endonuclease/exonuclease/phosphatase family protein [Micromonosporaceae bacterium]|jgi:endonuclease/exonuclease/phosphatase family metal-dependent hydrolase